MGSSISMACMSTRLVMHSCAAASEKSRAFCIISERSSSSTPSSSAVSIMSENSSTASSGSSSSASGFTFFVRIPMSRVTTKMSGRNTIFRNETVPAASRAKRLAFFLAVILGMVSPRMMTSTVTTAVATQVYLSFPQRTITSTEEREEQAMFTRLLPIRMALKESSKLRMISSTLPAFRSPSALICSMRSSFTEEKLISEAEKNAEHTMHRMMPVMRRTAVMLSPPGLCPLHRRSRLPVLPECPPR